MKNSKNYVWNGSSVDQSSYYKYRLENVIESGCTKDALYDLMIDLDMDTSVGGEWLYVDPEDRMNLYPGKE